MTLQGKRFSGWNYRVVKQAYTYSDGVVKFTYGIHESYYGPDVNTWSLDPVPVTGDSLDELRSELRRMELALELPIIDDTSVSAPDPEGTTHELRPSDDPDRKAAGGNQQ